MPSRLSPGVNFSEEHEGSLPDEPAMQRDAAEEEQPDVQVEEPHPVHAPGGRAEVDGAAVADHVLRPEDGALERRLDVVAHEPADLLGARLEGRVAEDLVGGCQEGRLCDIWRKMWSVMTDMGLSC